MKFHNLTLTNSSGVSTLQGQDGRLSIARSVAWGLLITRMAVPFN